MDLLGIKFDQTEKQEVWMLHLKICWLNNYVQFENLEKAHFALASPMHALYSDTPKPLNI